MALKVLPSNAKEVMSAGLNKNVFWRQSFAAFSQKGWYWLRLNA
jgi:hypothetical protein